MVIGERDGHANNLWRSTGTKRVSSRRGARSSRLAAADRRRAQAGARTALWPAAAGRDRDGAGAAPARAVARRAGGRRAVVGKPSHPRRGGGARSRHRRADHRARHGCRVPLRQGDHRAGAGRGVHARHAGGDPAQREKCARSISARSIAMAEPRASVDSTMCAPATARPWCWKTSASRSRRARPSRSSAAMASASRRCSPPSWAIPPCMAGASLLQGRGYFRLSPPIGA